MENWSYNGLQAVQPSAEVYIALRAAFRGGDTHCNRYFAEQIIENVGSEDRSSAYLDSVVNNQMPMGTFKQSIEFSIRHLNGLIRLHRAVLFRISFEGLELSDPYDPAPYISLSKVTDPNTGKPLRAKLCVLDNGRILKAPRGVLCLTDIDWLIIREQYKWKKAKIIDMWDTRYGYLPDILRQLIIHYYCEKTSCKHVEGKEASYIENKTKANSVYGLQAQDPCKAKTVYYPDASKLGKDLFEVEEGDILALLNKSRLRPYGSYQWGVWCTAIARYKLYLGRLAVGLDNVVYWDTDSIKFVGNADLKEYNKEIVEECKHNGAFATDIKGITHYIGAFETEDTAVRFITMGAKKYAYETKDGELKITVAGVSKKAGAAELKAAGGLEAFRRGMIFSAAGGVEAIYNDDTNLDVEIEGHKLHIGPNLYLKPSTYTLGLSDDYIQLLEDIELTRTIQHEQNLKNALTP